MFDWNVPETPYLVRRPTTVEDPGSICEFRNAPPDKSDFWVCLRLSLTVLRVLLQLWGCSQSPELLLTSSPSIRPSPRGPEFAGWARHGEAEFSSCHLASPQTQRWGGRLSGPLSAAGHWAPPLWDSALPSIPAFPSASSLLYLIIPEPSWPILPSCPGIGLYLLTFQWEPSCQLHFPPISQSV